MRKYAIAALALGMLGCGQDPLVPGTEWIEGVWLFEQGGCWPDYALTPATLGYSLEIDLSSDGVAGILHDHELVDRQSFIARDRTVDSQAIVVLDFERDVIGSRSSFRVEQDGNDGMTLADYGITDGCAYTFVRHD